MFAGQLDRFGRGRLVVGPAKVALEGEGVFQGDQRSFHHQLAGDLGRGGLVVSGVDSSFGDIDSAGKVIGRSPSRKVFREIDVSRNNEGQGPVGGGPDFGTDRQVPVDEDQNIRPPGLVEDPVDGLVPVDHPSPRGVGESGTGVGRGLPFAEPLPEISIGGRLDRGILGQVEVSLRVKLGNPVLLGSSRHGSPGADQPAGVELAGRRGPQGDQKDKQRKKEPISKEMGSGERI